MARRHAMFGTAATIVAIAIAVTAAGCGSPAPEGDDATGQEGTAQTQTPAESPADPTQEAGGGEGEKVTSETPADEGGSAEGDAGDTERLGAYSALTDLTADMVPKAAIYPEGRSADDIAEAVVSHMGKRHEGLHVRGVQIKGNGWDLSTGEEGVSSWTTYLLDTDGGDIGVRVLCNASGTMLVTEPKVLMIDAENGYDVEAGTIVSLSAPVSEDTVDEDIEYVDLSNLHEGMTLDELPPRQVVPVQKEDGSTVNVILRDLGK